MKIRLILLVSLLFSCLAFAGADDEDKAKPWCQSSADQVNEVALFHLGLYNQMQQDYLGAMRFYILSGTGPAHRELRELLLQLNPFQRISFLLRLRESLSAQSVENALICARLPGLWRDFENELHPHGNFLLALYDEMRTAYYLRIQEFLPLCLTPIVFSYIEFEDLTNAFGTESMVGRALESVRASVTAVSHVPLIAVLIYFINRLPDPPAAVDLTEPRKRKRDS